MKKVISIQDSKQLMRAIDLLDKNNISFEMIWGYDAMINDEIKIAMDNLFDENIYTFEEVEYIEDILRVEMESSDCIVDSETIAYIISEAINSFEENRKTIA